MRTMKTISNSQFYLAGECLKKNKQWFLDNRPTLPEAAKKLSELVGFEIAQSTVATLKDATGVKWEAKRYTGNGRATGDHKNAVNVLTRALRTLYKKLDEEVPEELECLYQSLEGKAVDNNRQ